MIDGVPVIDAVVHPYNLSEGNARGELGPMVREGFAQLHAHWNPPDLQAPRTWFQTDQSAPLLAETLFTESDVDLAVCHTLRLDSLFEDGLCSLAKTVELVDRWPGRFLGYAGLDPTLGTQRCLDDLDRQLEVLPGAVGIKLYPDQVQPYRTFRMDDPALCFPIYERANASGRSISMRTSPTGSGCRRSTGT